MKLPSHLVTSIFYKVVANPSTPRKNPGKMILRGRCPNCGDGKRKNKARLYCLESSDHWTVHCHNCEYSTTFEKMVESFFPEEGCFLQSQKIEFIRTGSVFRKEQSNEDCAPKIKPTDSIDAFFKNYFAFNCIKLDSPQVNNEKKEKLRRYAYKIMRDRGLPKRIVDSLYVCFKGKYIWRVIIPFTTEDGRVYNFQARDIHPEPDEARLNTKYLFAEFDNIELPDEKIYRYHQASKNRTVYVCEGIIDSMFIDNAIALCNANVTGEKAEKIKEEFPDRVWVLDSPWTDKTGYERTCVLLKSGEKCFIMPDFYKNEKGKIKDINDLAKVLDVELIPNDIINNNIYQGEAGLIKLRMKRLMCGA